MAEAAANKEAAEEEEVASKKANTRQRTVSLVHQHLSNIRMTTTTTPILARATVH
jgi:hypothetical protein